MTLTTQLQSHREKKSVLLFFFTLCYSVPLWLCGKKLMKKKLKRHLITFLKLIVAASIIYYMIATGKLDLRQIAEISHKKFMILKVILMLLGTIGLATIRWYYLLIWQGVPTSFTAVVRINCIGLFFNCFMPGTVGGDLIKAFYLAKENTENRTRSIMTIIIDRILGLETMMFVAFVALLLNYQTMLSNPQLQAIALAIGFYIICSLVAVVVVFSKRIKRFFIASGVKKLVYKLPKKEILLTIYDAFHIYSHQKTRLLKAMAITVVTDVLIVSMFYTIGKEIGEMSVSLPSYFTAIPVGLLMMSLPIAPAGVGIGQGAFYYIFPWFGAESGDVGASIITIYQLIFITVSMCFVVVYLTNKKDVKKAMISAQGEQI
jgi:uncharacterized protein (TIRG00374 family)